MMLAVSLNTPGGVVAVPAHNPDTVADLSKRMFAGILGMPAVYPIVMNRPSKAKLNKKAHSDTVGGPLTRLETVGSNRS